LKKIDQLLLRSFIGPFLLTFGIAMFVLIMQFLWKYVDDLVGKGLDNVVLAKLIFYLSASVVPLALPIAILLSAIMTLGSLGEHYELVSFKSAGVSLFRIMRPLLILTLGLSMGAFLFANYVLPVSNLKFMTLLYSVTKKRPALNIKEGVYYNGIDGYVIRVGEKEEGSRFMNDVQIYDHSEGKGNTRVLLAKRGEMYTTNNEKFMVFRLFDGVQYEEPRNGSSVQRGNMEFIRTYFKDYEMVFDLSDFDYAEANESMFKNNQKLLNVQQLFSAADSIEEANNNRSKVFYRNLNPYFAFLRDTAFLNKVAQLPTPNLSDSLRNDTTGLAFLQQLPFKDKEHQRNALDRAENLARNVKTLNPNATMMGKSERKKITRYLIEGHLRITLSLACLVLFLIGAPLGAIIRKGGVGLPMVVAILFFMLFHILSTMGKKFAEEQQLTPFWGMWLSIFILTPLGIFLTYKAMHDSNLFNLDYYLQYPKRWWEKIRTKFN
jgi:lipopolysaccharide export system permease protein